MPVYLSSKWTFVIFKSVYQQVCKSGHERSQHNGHFQHYLYYIAMAVSRWQ